MRAFLFGAGSSFGTLKGGEVCPPLAMGFGKALSKQSGFEERYPNLSLAAMEVGKKLSEVGLEDLWTCIDYYAKLSGLDANCALGPKPDWLDPAVRELKGGALLWLYGRRCDEAANALPDDCTVIHLLQSTRAGDVVVSFNYDTIIERLAKRRSLNLRHSRCPPGPFVRFLKPHGSASWPLRSLLSEVVDGEPLLDSLAEDMNNDPLLLGAVPIKSELMREVQRCYRTEHVFEVVMHQWRGVVEAVRDADELVVVGYSFPKEDHYGRFLFKQGLHLRNFRRIKRIEFYNTSADCETISDIFGELTEEIVWKGPVCCRDSLTPAERSRF
ncbi:MAG TPA: hypothetical protein VLW25_01330 [Bryobacteraceae bacterium]|nr:hypothetical protein [Bryobacteraceae bacterium]